MFSRRGGGLFSGKLKLGGVFIAVNENQGGLFTGKRLFVKKLRAPPPYK